MNTRSTRWLALIAAIAVVLYLCWLMLQPFVYVLIWGIVLAIISYPACQWLRKRGWSDHLSAMMTTVIVVMVVLIPLTFLTSAVVQQARTAVNAAIKGFHEIFDPNSPTLAWIGQYVDVEALKNPQNLSEKFSSMSEGVAKTTLGIVGGILGGILGAAIQIFFVLFTLYYLLRDADRIIPAVRKALPLADDQARAIFRRTHEVITASVNGVLVISAIQGLLGMIAFYALSLPSALLWGVMMFILSTIPMAGAFIVWIPAAIYLAVTGHWIQAIILTAWGSVVIGMIDNVLRPKLVGQRARLHELIIFFSVLGGLQVFGILGLFVGPVVAAIALALVDVIRQMNLSNESADAAPPRMIVDESAPPVSLVSPAIPAEPIASSPLQTPESAAAVLPDKTVSSGQ